MTSEDRQSTSSEETAHSKPWPDVVRLGQRIVRELGLEDSNDTLGRWMAHRIAELMERAEQAEDKDDREEARRECADLILGVWSRRSGWPYGQPLVNIASTIKGLMTEPGPYG